MLHHTIDFQRQNEIAIESVHYRWRGGQILREMAKRGERPGGGHAGDRSSSHTAFLENIGLTKCSRCMAWQPTV